MSAHASSRWLRERLDRPGMRPCHVVARQPRRDASARKARSARAGADVLLNADTLARQRSTKRAMKRNIFRIASAAFAGERKNELTCSLFSGSAQDDAASSGFRRRSRCNSRRQSIPLEADMSRRPRVTIGLLRTRCMHPELQEGSDPVISALHQPSASFVGCRTRATAASVRGALETLIYVMNMIS